MFVLLDMTLYRAGNEINMYSVDREKVQVPLSNVTPKHLVKTRQLS